MVCKNYLIKIKQNCIYFQTILVLIPESLSLGIPSPGISNILRKLGELDVVRSGCEQISLEPQGWNVELAFKLQGWIAELQGSDLELQDWDGEQIGSELSSEL